ncbi:cytochrome P450 [Mariniblastus sp.]|nr:cytochrome P450 [Mariniblastus sp.]
MLMQINHKTQTVNLNIRNKDFYNNPYPYYKKLQQQCPMFYWQEHGLWTFVDHQSVSSILRDRRFGRQIEHLKSREELGLPAIPSNLKPFFDVDRHSMLGLEPPSHTRLRGLVQKGFMAREIERLRGRIETLCHQLIDKIEDNCGTSNFDFKEQYATPIPVIVIAEMLGVPETMAPELLRWSHNMIKMYEMQRTPEMESAAVESSREFVNYLRSLVHDRRKRPQQDLISKLIEVESAGDRLSEDELIANCILLLNAGHEATVNVLSNGMVALFNHPQQLALWRDHGPGDTPFSKAAVEELLRFDTPLHQFNRWVLEPLAIGGQHFEIGQEIALILGAANRDPAVFQNPHLLQLDRHPNPHVSFGGGIHYCLGAPLARLEIQISIPIFLQRLPYAQIKEQPVYANTYHFHGLESITMSTGVAG